MKKYKDFNLRSFFFNFYSLPEATFPRVSFNRRARSNYFEASKTTCTSRSFYRRQTRQIRRILTRQCTQILLKKFSNLKIPLFRLTTNENFTKLQEFIFPSKNWFFYKNTATHTKNSAVDKNITRF